MIPITKPFLPPKKEYEELIQGIWDRNWLTNFGPLSVELEEKISQYFNLPFTLLTSNGTIGLQMVLKSLPKKGKIITTPFSYIATSSSIVWEDFEPVFADIDPQTLNIGPANIQSLLSEEVVGILPTHCFGNACDIEKIDAIAKQAGVPVFYDAAHCFGTKYDGKSIFEFGTASVTSFHATKLFHTIEGGAIFTADSHLQSSLTYMRNFGHHGPERIAALGINGKSSEFHAAMGLVNLRYIEKILESRESQYKLYLDLVKGLPIETQKIQEKCEINFSYFPIIFENEERTKAAEASLIANDIFPRRYFFPSLSTLPYVKERYACPTSEDLSKRILCLPMFFGMEGSIQERVIEIIADEVNT